jgi:hypothetical protein
MRRHAASRRFIIKRKNSISRTSRLEGTDLLKILAFKKQGRPARVIQPRIHQHGRPMNIWANPLVCCTDRIQVE